MIKILGGIGKPVIEIWRCFWGIMGLFTQTIEWIFLGPFRKKMAKSEGIFQQMVFVGVRSLVIVFFVTFFTGIVIAMQSAYQLERLGAVMYVASLVSVSMARELGPVLTSLVVAGRVGAAIAAELGTMKVTEQVEALESMALNPVRVLVVPRFLALIVMLPCLTIFGDVAGMIGGFLVGTASLGINPALYIDINFKFLEYRDIFTGLLKSVVFGGIIAMIGCYYGLNTRGGAEGVGKATTTSVVSSFIMIILADCVLTALFYFSSM